ncbi:uncharacterized protein LOC135836760 [Planococcus citri]|uniref:uncharacterized protein LOC135836760 n=1 Tax=Planococcus citri TaxID=170843 RepID=UPI0031F868C3
MLTTLLFLCLVTIAASQNTTAKRGRPRDIPFVVNRPFGRIKGIETQNFVELLKSDFYFDKTLILKEILKPQKHKTILITLPAKWGKSSNLDMMKTFFEIEVDDYGNQITPKERSVNYRLFQKGELVLKEKTISLKKPLLISSYDTLLNQYQGQFPVIYLNFGNLNGTSYRAIIQQVGQRIREGFARHEYMITVLNDELKKAISETRKNITETKLHGFLTIFNDQGNYEDLIKSLELLSRILYDHFGSKVFVLIDDYEGVLLNAQINEAITETEFPLILAFFSSLMVHSFQTNIYLEKCILTGTFRMLSSIPHLTDVKEYKAINHMMMKLYSIAHDDLTMLFDHLNMTTYLRTKFTNWYGGYRGGPEFSYTIYSPHSIMNFISTKKLDYYKTRHAMFDPVFESTFKYSKMRIYILWLIYGKLFLISHRQSGRRQNLEDFLDFKKVLHTTKNPFDDLAIEPYLCAAGTLTLTQILNSFGTKARIPTNAVRMEVADKLMEYYKSRFRVSSWFITRAVKNLGSYISDEEDNLQNTTVFLESLTRNQALMKDIEDSKSEEKEILQLFLSFIFNYLSFRVTLLYDFQMESIEQVQPDSWILFNDQRAAFIQVRVNATSSKHVLNIAKNYAASLSRFTCLGILKFIGVNFTPTGAVEISTESHTGSSLLESNYTTKSPAIFV